MTNEEFNKIKNYLQSPDQEMVFMAYLLIVSDKKYEDVKKLYAKTQIDNSTCPSIGNTISKICGLFERVLADNSTMKKSWPVLREDLYKPAGMIFLETTKDYLIN